MVSAGAGPSFRTPAQGLIAELVLLGPFSLSVDALVDAPTRQVAAPVRANCMKGQSGNVASRNKNRCQTYTGWVGSDWNSKEIYNTNHYDGATAAKYRPLPKATQSHRGQIRRASQASGKNNTSQNECMANKPELGGPQPQGPR